MRLTFRVLETELLEVDAGRGVEIRISTTPAEGAFTGDVGMRAHGWRRGFDASPWRITQRAPEGVPAAICNHRDQGERLMGGLSNLATVGLDLALTQQARRNADKEIKKQRRREVAERTADLARAEKEQTDLLKRRVAAARARAGGAGISTSGGSIDAIVRGLQQGTGRSVLELREDDLPRRRRHSAPYRGASEAKSPGAHQ